MDTNDNKELLFLGGIISLLALLIIGALLLLVVLLAPDGCSSALAVHCPGMMVSAGGPGAPPVMIHAP